MKHQTVREELEHRFRFLDPPSIIYDKKAVAKLYKELGGKNHLAEVLEIPQSAAYDLIKMHGIQMNAAGGNRHTEPEYLDDPLEPNRDPRDLMREVGDSYTAREKVAMIATHHGKHCKLYCPMFWTCWDSTNGHGRLKRQDCTLGRHLKLTGVIRG